MNDLTIWLTYHDDKQIQEFGLKATNWEKTYLGLFICSHPF